MRIPILNGVYTDESSDFRSSYPRNLIPVPKDTGVSSGYLRPGDGITQFGSLEGPGLDRGAINWNDKCYRVMGTKLIHVSSTGGYIEIGDVGGTSQVTFDYGPTYLAIASNNNLFLYDGTTLQQVTDSDLGDVLDVLWVDGYYMTTDGEFLIVTNLDDPFSVDPFKYGSSEADPDSIRAILKIRNEVYAMNRHTVEVFDNIGGEGFPFIRIEGAQIEKGTLGTHTACVFMETVAFLGSGFNEAPAIYMGTNSTALKISTREIDQIIQKYDQDELTDVVCESKVDKTHQHLLIHLPNETLVYDGPGSQVVGEPVWFILDSSLLGGGKYRAKNHVWCYDRWVVGDTITSKIGELSSSFSSHFGDDIGWDFGTTIVYNESKGAIFNSLELVSLTGRVDVTKNPVLWTQYSLDGETWSMEKSIIAGRSGQRNKRLVWRQQSMMRNIRIQRFRGTSDSHLSFARLEAEIEPLYV